MDFDTIYELNPSEVIQRIETLKNKQDFEGITKEEVAELNQLKDVLDDSVGDMHDDVFTY